MVTLAGYARREGYSRGTILGRQRRAAFPARAATLAPGGRRSAGVYRDEELDLYFAAHPVLPVMTWPVPPGLVTLRGYGERAGRAAARSWRSRPGFPVPVGQLGRTAGPKV